MGMMMLEAGAGGGFWTVFLPQRGTENPAASVALAGSLEPRQTSDAGRALGAFSWRNGLRAMPENFSTG